ncbi:MAG: hypothetical protein JWR40_2895 [Massilia sp.]|nr:hypothetical protein [Massilia sp.]
MRRENPRVSPRRRFAARWPWRRVGPVAAIAALAALFAWLMHQEAAAPATAATAAAAPGRQIFSRIDIGGAPPGPAASTSRRRELVDNLVLADHTYCSYRDSTRYPHTSRPIAEQPDQVYPNAPVSETHAMRQGGGAGDPKVQVQTSQSRVYMAAGETVSFSLRALDTSGQVLPLVVTRAVAQGITFKGGRATAQVALAFADDGTGADAQAADGSFAAVLAPAQTGLAAFNGTIRAEVRYSVGGNAGSVLFDVIYSPELPARWTGQVREAVEDGSLAFYLKAEVRQAGRYVVSGRVDDAKGKPFALVSFNDVLGAGTNEVRLTMFGKLLRDQEAALPLTLRDVDGYLLKENLDPDRALMPRLEGKVFTGKPHPLNAFSDAEWQGEERSRYLAEFGKDLARARSELAGFDPAAPLPPSECAPAENR